jgi:hypothetical protein
MHTKMAQVTQLCCDLYTFAPEQTRVGWPEDSRYAASFFFSELAAGTLSSRCRVCSSRPT